MPTSNVPNDYAKAFYVKHLWDGWYHKIQLMNLQASFWNAYEMNAMANRTGQEYMARKADQSGCQNLSR